MSKSDNISSTVEVRTFGCRLNIHESEVVRSKAAEAGLEELSGGAVVINTCAVTGEAVRQAKQAIRRVGRERPDAKLIVTGCAAQANPSEFAGMDEVGLVIGNEEKFQASSYRALPEYGVNDPDKVRVGDIMGLRNHRVAQINHLQGRTRAFVQVQNGCDHRCTFCIIPYGRGNSRSAPMDEVVEQVRKLVANGYLEVVLTGVDTTSYGADLTGSPSLGNLVQRILQEVPDLQRLRLSSVDSVEVNAPLLEVIASETRFMPHLHLSLQHGHDLILKRMKRRHSRSDSIEFCQKLKTLRPDMVFGADLIAGFPTETEAMFEETLSVVDACGLSFLHVFPFSPRKGTPAARMPQLERSAILDRAARLRARGEQSRLQLLDTLVGSIQAVLIEHGGSGYTPQYVPVKADASAAGKLMELKITGHDGKNLIGEPQRELQVG